MAAASVRAKAAMFAQLSGGDGGSSSNRDGNNRTVNNLGIGSSTNILGNSFSVNKSSSSSKSSIKLPPVSSSPNSDPSISHPISTKFFPKITTTSSTTTAPTVTTPPSPYTAARLRAAAARANDSAASAVTAAKSSTSSGIRQNDQTMTTPSSKRKQVDKIDISKSKADIDEKSKSSTEESPPTPPQKSYQPKLSTKLTHSPLDINFPKEDSDNKLGESNAQQQSRIPRPISKSPKPIKVVQSSIGKSSINGKEPDLSRESVYSTTSSLGGTSAAIVTTANAVSIQRMANPARSIGSSATQTKLKTSKASQATSVEKGIGVRPRRKSRESLSSEKRRPKSGRTSNSGINSSIDQNEEEDSKIRNIAKSSLNEKPRFPSAAQQGLGAINKNSITRFASSQSRLQTDRLQPLDISSANRSVSSPSQSLRAGTSISSASSNDSSNPNIFKSRWSATSTNQDPLDPLSDTWGQNISVSGQMFDNDELLSMGALSFSPISIGSAQTNSRFLPNEKFQFTLQAPEKGAGFSQSRMTELSPKSKEKCQNDHNRQINGILERVNTTKPGDSPINLASRNIKDEPKRLVQSAAPTTFVSNNKKPIKMANVSTKDALLMQLLASMSMLDAQSFQSMQSLEEVESLKKDLSRVEREIVDVRMKLKVHIRMRDAADKVRKVTVRARNGSGTHNRSMSITSSAATPISPEFPLSSNNGKVGHNRRISGSSNSAGVSSTSDMQQSEADAAAAMKKVDSISRKLLELFDESASLRRQLLEHHSKILASRVESLELEVQQAEQNHQNHEDEDESSKVGALLAIEELDSLRDKLARVDQALEHERKDRQTEVEGWRKKYEEDLQSLKSQHESIRNESSSSIRQLMDQQRNDSVKAQGKQNDLEERIRIQDEQIQQNEERHSTLKRQMEQLEFETTAERNIMMERQKLFSAFEQRLERAEARLREQDDRCARMLGKAEGREEMDDLLNQIKYGAAGVNKKEKTAGQDIDTLIDSLTTHINDLEDELRRSMANGLRIDMNNLDSMGDEMNKSSETIQNLNEELHSAHREAEEWRTQAESAQRRLAAVQRQSAISMSSTNNGRLSVSGGITGGQNSFGSGFGGRRPSNATSTYIRASGSPRSAAELEARITLLERRNASLEADLNHAREEGLSVDTSPDLLGKENSSSFMKPSNSFTKLTSRKMTNSINGTDLHSNTLSTLMEILPSLDPETTDLHEIQEELESMPHNEGIDISDSNSKEVCRIVLERTRAILFVGRSMIGKLLALEMEKRDLEEEMNSLQTKEEEMKVAIEDMRNGHASQMQIIEANKNREQQLVITLNELEKELEETRKAVRQQIASASSSLSPSSALLNSSPSLTSLISSQAINSSTVVPLHQRRNLKPINRNGNFSSSSNLNVQSTSSSPSLRGTKGLPIVNSSLISPSSSKFSLSSTGQSNSTPATSHPNWSPSVAGNGIGNITTNTTMTSLSDSNPTISKRQINSTTNGNVDPTPRTMMLGMGVNEMMEKIRRLESDLALTKVQANRTKVEEIERSKIDEQLIAYKNELESNRIEMEEIRNVESRQRIELLEELTNLTSELSDARAQLRQRADQLNRIKS